MRHNDINEPVEYEFRILAKRARWTMGNPYEEWYRPTGVDYQDEDLAVATFTDNLPFHDGLKIQRRPKIEDWSDYDPASVSDCE